MYKVNIKIDEKLSNESTINGIYYFNLAKIYSLLNPSIKTSIYNGLESYGTVIPAVAEDLLNIALSVYALDKRFPRINSTDAWTREFSVEIPVYAIAEWTSVKSEIDAMLCFLSGDLWDVKFVKTEHRIIKPSIQTTNNLHRNFDCISLFSGGLDSFCGAIKFLEEKKTVLFIGNEEYPKLKQRQEKLIDILHQNYNQSFFEIKTFTSNVQSYIYNGKISKSTENTTRTRSFLFLAAAICYSTLMNNPEIPVYIPENGFIGLNLPITPSRIGTCSTRTTHPKFLRMLNNILHSIGFKTTVQNPYKYLSKADVVKTVENSNAFKEGAALTISCSHPSINRYTIGGTYPKNCGYCYPCLIRKSSLAHLNLTEDYTFDLNNSFWSMSTNKKDDIRSMLYAARQYKLFGRNYIIKRIEAESNLEPEEIEPFTNLYIKTMDDFISIITNQKLKDYAGL